MTLRISGKNMDIGEAMRSQVEARLVSALGKYFDRDYSGHVTVARDGTGFRTDCVLHLASGVTLEASGAAHDAYGSFDQTAARIEKRLRRYKRRLRDRHPTNGRGGEVDGRDAAYTVFQAPEEDWEEGEEAEFHPAVIAETTKALHQRSVSDAVLELDMTGAPLVVFLHAGTGRVNIVYRRGDGMIGWIDPPAEQG
jgi:ribosomal subunit interface protein